MLPAIGKAFEANSTCFQGITPQIKAKLDADTQSCHLDIIGNGLMPIYPILETFVVPNLVFVLIMFNFVLITADYYVGSSNSTDMPPYKGLAFYGR